MIPPDTWPVEVDVSIHSRPDHAPELANITLGYGQGHITYYVHRMVPEMLAKSLALSTLHEITHWILASANEDYWNERLAEFGENTMFSWLYGQNVLDHLDNRIQEHNER